MRNYIISSVQETNLTNQNGVYQDSLIAHDKDAAGRTWAVLGHTNLGGISVWSGESLCSLQKKYPAELLFSLGEAGNAFNAIAYPDGPMSRGQIWPCGLWIHPDTNRFYCFVHNETGWGAGASSYTANGFAEGEPDFRHIGMMYSDDNGKTWKFSGWLLTAQEPCWTERFRVGMNTPGQQGSELCLGCGDFSIFADKQNRKLYMFYTKHTIHTELSGVVTDKVYLARCTFDELDNPSAWRKYTESGFTEPGNCGHDTSIVNNGAIASVLWDENGKRYIMSTYNRMAWQRGVCTCQLSYSDDLLHWTLPELISTGRSDLSKPYLTICPEHNALRIFMSSNGTDICSFTLMILE